MNRTYFALFVALLIHTIFFLLFYILLHLQPIEKKNKVQEHRLKIALKELHGKKPTTHNKAVKKELVTPKKHTTKNLLKKISKKSVPKKTSQKKLIQKHKKNISNKVTKKLHKHIKPLAKIKHTTHKHLSKLQTKKKVQEKKSALFDILSKDYSTQQEKKSSYSMMKHNAIQQNIKELYGDTFKTLSKNQQQYIINNQEIMRRITQRVLNRVARVNIGRDLRVNSSNIVEFYLYPNGDISDLHFLKKSNMFLLNETTKETIEYAYSQYPRPKEKTLIRYNVFYNLAR